MADITTHTQIRSETYDKSLFNYQPRLTDKLRTAKLEVVTQEWVNEVVLWKLNRYAELDKDTLLLLNDPIVQKDHLDEPFIRRLLLALLNVPGVGLPMASTFLRFINPAVFQIIDQRAYRFVYGEELSLGYGNSESTKEKQIRIYLDYLKKLREVSIEKKWPFEQLDEILYVLDKQHNGELPIKR